LTGAIWSGTCTFIVGSDIRDFDTEG
jgi:hypothetical protein